ncbi:MAG: heavy metal translocating P-type ATPase [Clostridiales bacterium]|nr:heavy metal translocating P-type ATPase [Clostridiales bacterium]
MSEILKEKDGCCCCEQEHGCCCEHEGNVKIKLIRLICGGVLFAAGLFLPEKISIWVFLADYLLVGYDVLLASIKNIGRGRIFDENLLMSAASIGAFLIGEHPEAAAVMLFYQVGEMLQDRAVEKSRGSIAELMDIRPDYANIDENGSIRRVAPEEVVPGEVIVVNPGERIPLDGKVIKGESFADCSALTGESVPVRIGEGSEVLSGAINTASPVWIRVGCEYSKSTVARILELTENAQERKAKTERFITVFAKYYTPIVVFGALLLMLIPSIITGEWSKWIYRGLVFLAVSCPCALVISVPLGFFAGIGGASRRGILIKGGSYIERLANLEYMVFDKTGTLTEGRFEIINIDTKLDKDEFLRICAMGEYYSSHPIAASIKEYFGGELDPSCISGFMETAGEGVCAEVDGKKVAMGSRRLVPGAPKLKSTATVIYVSIDGEYCGYIEIGDKIKDDAKEAVSALRKMGIHTAMISGDRKSAAEEVGRELGIEAVYSQMLPRDKVTRMEEIIKSRSPKKYAAYSGDGINDAPVLAIADVGISMGAVGSDSAVEASDIVLMHDEPSAIITAIRLAKKTMRIVKENVVFALGVKALIMLLSIFGIANIWMAIFGDVGVALIAIANSLRAGKIK